MSDEVKKDAKTKEVAPQWLRTLKSTYVYPATEAFLKRNDLYPCDIKGVLLSSGTTEPLKSETTEASNPKTNENDTEAAAENSRQIALLERAKELGIKNAHTMKEETLVAKIAEAETAANVGASE